MRVVRLVAPRKMEIVEQPDPVTGAGEVLVRMKEVAICGSDLITYLNTMEEATFPARDGKPAHECVGIIETSDMDGFAAGDPVLYFPPHQDGLRTHAVATDPIQLLKLPDEESITHWMMAQLLGTVIFGARKLDGLMSENVAVVGQGPVGQLFNHLTWNLGARMVVGIDPIAERLEVSPRMHATHTLQYGEVDVMDEVKKLTGGRGMDVVIEASGYDESINLAYEIVRRDGRLLQFGAPKHRDQVFAPRLIYDKRLKVFGTVGPDVERDMGTALDYIVQGRIDPSPIITHRYPLDEVQDAYELYAERRKGCVKVIVEL